MTNVMNLDDLRFPLKAAAMVAGQCGGAVLAAGQKRHYSAAGTKSILKKGIIRLQIPNQSKQSEIQTKIICFTKKYSGLASALSGGAREHFPLIRVK